MEISPALVSALCGLLISLAADYMPRLREWFAGLTPPQKVAFVVVANIAIATGLAIYQHGLDWPAVGQAVINSLTALLTSQATHGYTRKL